MKIKLIRYVNFFLTGAIILMLGFKIYHINKINFDIDLLKKQLKPIKDHIKPGSTVGLDVTTRYKASFMAIEYAMAPQMLVPNSSPDSVIIMQDKTDKLLDVKHHQIITQSIIGEKEILLVKRIK